MRKFLVLFVVIILLAFSFPVLATALEQLPFAPAQTQLEQKRDEPAARTVSFDFEDGWQGWQVLAGDLGWVRRPTAQCPVSVQKPENGKFILATDYRRCGLMESPVFKIAGRDASSSSEDRTGSRSKSGGCEATFLLGGAGSPHAYITLHAEDGQELLRTNVPVASRATGDEWQLQTTCWDVSSYVGERVFMRITANPIGYTFNKRGAGGKFQESCVILDNFHVDGFIDQEATSKRLERLARNKQQSMAAIRDQLGEIVFAVRKADHDGHWYADFGHWSGDPEREFFHDGTRLCVLNVSSGKLTTLLDDPRGTIRDPQVHYDAKKVIFSYRPDGSEHFHLYEIDIDRTASGDPVGTNLRQLTFGQYDDYEPSYFPGCDATGGEQLPDLSRSKRSGDRIIFCSSRCKRFVPCYFTEVAVLHSCNADGSDIRMLSPNVEHENTPWPLPDGRILYTRWEYVERSVLDFHHLWTAAPDGRSQAVFYGNMHPGYLMIDAKPISGSGNIVCSMVPGHTRKEHAGTVTVIDPSNGPDDKSSITRVGWTRYERDPYPIGNVGFLVANFQHLLIMDYEGRTERLWSLSDEDNAAGYMPQEPRPLEARLREPVVADRIDLNQKTGVLALTDVYQGRNMEGIKRGSIKKLLVLESLPKALNISNGSEPTSRFAHNHERVLGTVPVEPDGSASFEVPASRAIFLAALDENDIAVKRMQSFLTVQPGEVASCVGCHEERIQTPQSMNAATPIAMRRMPSRIEPITDVPDVFDFHRDIQPIFDHHCIACHDYDATEQGGPRAGGIIMTGDLGPAWAHSYSFLAGRFVTLGKNTGNNPPFSTGSGGSRLMKYIDGSHHSAKPSEHEQKMIRLWIDSGAMYTGTLAAEGTGMIYNQIGKQNVNYQVATYDWFAMPDEWPERLASAREVVERRCNGCHATNKTRTALPELDVTFFTNIPPPKPVQHIERILNLTRPDKSSLLLAPLSQSAGGFRFCHEKGDYTPVFADKNDPDYKILLDYMNTLHEALDRNKRCNMEGFRPSPHYFREMKRYGILPADFDEKNDPIDPYATDQKYWKSFWLE